MFKVRKNDKNLKDDESTTNTNDWSDEAHNTKMDKIESEMNKKNGPDK
jgi:hypothetical protein